ncbi:VOC family protein [Kitasatospora sp. NPDC096077]|uniref:VOC family protein n=1 Tax=Kitasatospora sp. NPDC096077 TaxID=3155544 RepID=UPI00332FC54B
MTLRRMDHVGIVVDDLPAVTAFFLALGLQVQREGSVEGGWVERVVGLEGVRADFTIVQTPDGHSRLELTKYHSPQGPQRPPGDGPAPSNTPGIHHIGFAVDDLDTVLADLTSRGARLVGAVERYKNQRMCYVRGPENIVVELSERTG